MKKNTVLTKHLKLCEEAYDLMLQENQWLKTEKTIPQDSIISRKRNLLDALKESNRDLNTLRKEGISGDADNDLAKKAQNMLLKIFMLDRENEQLLLRTTLKEQNLMKGSMPSTKQLKATYNKDDTFKRT